MPDALLSASTTLTAELTQKSFEEQAVVVFEGELRARRAGSRERTKSFWGPLSPPVQAWRGVSPEEWCAGCEGVGLRIEEAARESLLTISPAALPLYITNYIFDGDELSPADLVSGAAFETAQYSCHVVGLVLDPEGKVCYICDPNGQLLAGGNMEFVSIPLAPREAPTTALSAFDIELARGAQSSGGRKRAKKKRY